MLLCVLALALVPLPKSGLAADDAALHYVVVHYGKTLLLLLVAVLAAHVALGLALGAFAAVVLGAWDRALGRSPSPRRRWLETFALSALVLSWAILAVFARYPQLFDSWLYESGGAARALEVWAARRLAPGAITASLALFLGALVLLPLATQGGRHAARALVRRRSVRLGASAALVSVVLPLVSTLRRPAPVLEDPSRPDILMLGVDSLRPDRLTTEVAPNLARLAAESVRFDEAHTTIPRTYSSLATLLTGRWPQLHGIRHMFPTRSEREHVGLALPQVLRERGYATAGLAGDNVGAFSEVDLGFDEHDREIGGGGITNEIVAALTRRHLALLPFTTTELAHDVLPALDSDWWNWDPERLADRTVRALESTSRRGPSFVCSFFLTSHLPYAAPNPYCTRFTREGYTGRFGFDAALVPDPESPEDLAQLRGLYDGAVAATDAAIGRILAWLQATGRSRRTIVVVFSDHGQNLGELDRGFGHGNHLRGENALRTVLLVRDPVHAFPPHAVPGVVRDVDVAPTLAALAGTTLPGASGVDLGEMLRGRAQDLALDAPSESEIRFAAPRDDEVPIAPFPKFLDVEGDAPVVRADLRETVLYAKERALRSGPWKLHYKPTTKGAQWRLYSVAEDPDEAHDLAAERADVFAALREKLVSWARVDGTVLEDGYLKPRPGFAPRAP
jgi:arylsulfatase A-like enzyme